MGFQKSLVFIQTFNKLVNYQLIGSAVLALNCYNKQKNNTLKEKLNSYTKKSPIFLRIMEWKIFSKIPFWIFKLLQTKASLQIPWMKCMDSYNSVIWENLKMNYEL